MHIGVLPLHGRLLGAVVTMAFMGPGLLFCIIVVVVSKPVLNNEAVPTAVNNYFGSLIG